MLWFAFKLVSLNHWEQFLLVDPDTVNVVICFQISIFEPLGTISAFTSSASPLLWFAFKLVSLNHWEQSMSVEPFVNFVVICFQISIFEPLGTIYRYSTNYLYRLWFAFKLVSLNHWEQYYKKIYLHKTVVICFQISIFEPLGTIKRNTAYWTKGCDLLSN